MNADDIDAEMGRLEEDVSPPILDTETQALNL
jgi:hypothetical protein